MTQQVASHNRAPSPAEIQFEQQGWAEFPELLSLDEVEMYRDIYDRLLSGEIDAGHLRSDLGAGSDRNGSGAENITQIMWPSALVPAVHSMPLHQRGLELARRLIGDDAELDFDMLIDKAPYSNTPTPWHQDAGYWVDLPDHRAVSLWVSLDDATLDSGCMWYVTGSHRSEIRTHWPAGKGGGAIECSCSEEEPGATYVPLKPGSAAAHAGRTLHYSRGNTTGGHRRAYIVNYRPGPMIARERELGMDHGRESNKREVRSGGCIA